MFEFHGWVNIVADDTDDAGIAVLDERQRVLADEISHKISDMGWSAGHFTVHRGLNGQQHLLVTGFANHRQDRVVELFRWIAARQPHSYGLLHIRDDEDSVGSHDNDFQVFAIARGTVTEATETLLSPCIPKIEAFFE